jgi:hypothetical protein
MESERLFPCSQEPKTPIFWAKWIQSMSSHSISLRSILILHFHLCLGLQSCLFPSPRPRVILRNILLLFCWEIVSTGPTSELEDQHLSIFHFYSIIRNSFPYLETVFSISKLWMLHAVMIRDALNLNVWKNFIYNFLSYENYLRMIDR